MKNKIVLLFVLLSLLVCLGAGAAIQIIDFTYTLPDIPGQDPEARNNDPNGVKLNDSGLTGGGHVTVFGGWAASNPIVIDVDMQSYAEIEKINLWTTEDSTNQYVGRYKIYTSQDNINWTELLEVTNPEPRLTENPPSRKIYAIPADNLNLRTRYLRIESYRGASQQVLGELEIFGRRLPYLEVEKPVIMPWRGEELAITAESLEGAFVTLDIINPKNGSVVKNLVSGGSGETVQAAWDGKDSQGNFVPAGRYLVRGQFTIDGIPVERELPVYLDYTTPRNTAQITGITYYYPDDANQDMVAVNLDPDLKKLTDGGINWGGSTNVNSQWGVKNKQIIVVFDLKQVYELHEVKVWTEEIDKNNRMGHFELYVSEDGEEYIKADQAANPTPYRLSKPPEKEHYSLDINLNTRARYVKIVVFPDPDSRIGNHFLCEVQFFGEATPQLLLNKNSFSPALNQKVHIAFEAAALSPITIVSSTGGVVRTFSPGSVNGILVWDGKDSDGAVVPDGAYIIRLGTSERTVNVKSQGPSSLIITSPVLPEEGELEHNQDFLVITGSSEGAATVVVYSGEEIAAEGSCELSGAFSISVPLSEGDNHLKVKTFDELGNPCLEEVSFTVNYDPERPFGMPTIINGDLLSPANGDGYRDELTISFYLKPAGTAYLNVFDSAGREVYVQEFATAGEEVITFTWDGREEDFAADGVYILKVGVQVGSEDIPFFTKELIIDNTPPAAPILLYPASGATVTSLGLKLKWEAAADALYYLVYLGTDEDLDSETPVQSKAAELAINLESKGTYYWLVKAVDAAGNISEGSQGSFEVSDLNTSSFNLSNFAMTPNPFTPGLGKREQLAISFSLQQPGEVAIAIYNLAGKVVKRLEAGKLAAGDHLFMWDGTDERGQAVQKGTYLVRVTAENSLYGPVPAITQPVLLLK
ncbi:MAG TPA: FlgD immunoglobulin-like domain containing protein [Bacillota bacterium]|nr:FlgD immunoglobulin-like domain containing protein [Bacillota bacterium]